MRSLQVVSAHNMVSCGHALEVGRKVELLMIKQAELQARDTERKAGKRAPRFWRHVSGSQMTA